MTLWSSSDGARGLLRTDRQCRKQGQIAIHEQSLITMWRPIPGGPIVGEAIGSAPLEPSIFKRLQHRKKNCIRLFITA